MNCLVLSFRGAITLFDLIWIIESRLIQNYKTFKTEKKIIMLFLLPESITVKYFLAMSLNSYITSDTENQKCSYYGKLTARNVRRNVYSLGCASVLYLVL